MPGPLRGYSKRSISVLMTGPSPAPAAPEEIERERQASKKREGDLERPPLDTVVDHILHVARIAGIDHVGLGSDFDGIPAVPEGLEDCASLPALTGRLLARGLSEADVRKTLGGNLLRVMERAIDQA